MSGGVGQQQTLISDDDIRLELKKLGYGNVSQDVLDLMKKDLSKLISHQTENSSTSRPQTGKVGANYTHSKIAYNRTSERLSNISKAQPLSTINGSPTKSNFTNDLPALLKYRAESAVNKYALYLKAKNCVRGTSAANDSKPSSISKPYILPGNGFAKYQNCLRTLNLSADCCRKITIDASENEPPSEEYEVSSSDKDCSSRNSKSPEMRASSTQNKNSVKPAFMCSPPDSEFSYSSHDKLPISKDICPVEKSQLCASSNDNIELVHETNISTDNFNGRNTVQNSRCAIPLQTTEAKISENCSQVKESRHILDIATTQRTSLHVTKNSVLGATKTSNSGNVNGKKGGPKQVPVNKNVVKTTKMHASNTVNTVVKNKVNSENVPVRYVSKTQLLGRYNPVKIKKNAENVSPINVKKMSDVNFIKHSVVKVDEISLKNGNGSKKLVDSEDVCDCESSLSSLNETDDNYEKQMSSSSLEDTQYGTNTSYKYSRWRERRQISSSSLESPDCQCECSKRSKKSPVSQDDDSLLSFQSHQYFSSDSHELNHENRIENSNEDSHKLPISEKEHYLVKSISRISINNNETISNDDLQNKPLKKHTTTSGYSSNAEIQNADFSNKDDLHSFIKAKSLSNHTAVVSNDAAQSPGPDYLFKRRIIYSEDSASNDHQSKSDYDLIERVNDSTNYVGRHSNSASSARSNYYRRRLELLNGNVTYPPSGMSPASSMSDLYRMKRKVLRHQQNGMPVITEEFMRVPNLFSSSYPETETLNSKSLSIDNLALKPKPSYTRSLDSTPRSVTSSHSSPLRSKSGRAKKKADPVAMYKYYKKFWDEFKPPGEKSHDRLRWAVRDKMLDYDL